MKKIILCLGLFLGIYLPANAQNKSELDVYTNFLKSQNTTAKDYIFELFEKNDIVILCERDHREMTQYDFILGILNDKRFAQYIGNAYFEIGNNNYNGALNNFLHDSELTSQQVSDSVMYFQRNIYGAALWEKANYSYFLKNVYNINKKLPQKKKINIHGLDIGIDWRKEVTENDIRNKDALMPLRDSVLAANFLTDFKKQGSKKALVILNYRHAFTKDIFGRENAGRFIAEAYPGKVANVLINSFVVDNSGSSSDGITAAQDGKWDAAFIKSEKNNIGFNLAKTPFGKDSFDMIPFKNDMVYSDMFTGFVYYNYLPNFRIVSGIEGFIDDTFAPELIKRYKLEQKVYGNEVPDINKLKEDYNTVTDMTYKECYPDMVAKVGKWMK